MLTLKWPSGLDPMTMSGFETKARTLRYQALGKACRDDMASTLLAAHHAGDLAESMLLRISKGHRAFGLRGLVPRTRIPECQSIHGVYEDCQAETSRQSYEEMIADRFDIEKEWLLPRPSSGAASSFEIGIATCGMDICRPFLNFKKERLISTCRHHGIAWVEDHTNDDPSLTPRNTVRSLLQKGSLPAALQLPALSALNDKLASKQEICNNLTKTILRSCTIQALDLRSGRLVIHMPKEPIRLLSESDQKKLSKKDLAHVWARVTEKTIALVSPGLPKRSQRSVQSIVSMLKQEHKGRSRAASNISHVEISVRSSQDEKENIYSTLDKAGNRSMIPWLMHRQIPRKVLGIPICPVLTSDDPIWYHWDDRYWFQLSLNLCAELKLAFLTDEHLNYLKRSLGTYEWLSLKRMLLEAAPGKIRYTLPVFLEREQPVALPTLGFRTPLSNERLSWKVKYKSLSFPWPQDF